MEDEQLLEAEKEFKRFYKLSLWWVNNREKLKKVGLGVLIAIDASLLLFALWTFIDTYLISYNRENTAIAQMVSVGQADLHAYTVAKAAKPLDISKVKVLSAGDGRYDYYVSITNQNTDWYADITYRFDSSAGETREEKGFILPNQEKPFVFFGYESTSLPRSAEFKIIDIGWHRLDHKAVGEYEPWEADRLDFEISNIELTSELEVDTKTIGRVSFTVENQGAFSFHDPVFTILLMRGPNVVGVNRTTLTSIDSGEKVNVDINWFGTLPSASKVEVIPEINIFDLSVYKALEGESTTDTRERVFPGRR